MYQTVTLGTCPVMQIRDFPSGATSTADIVICGCKLLAVEKRLNCGSFIWLQNASCHMDDVMLVQCG